MSNFETFYNSAEFCECNNYSHSHLHQHDHDHEHGFNHEKINDGIHVEHHVQDDACVTSGDMDISGKYDELRLRIKDELERLASKVEEAGGIIGHIKASAEVNQTEMFSVTETTAMVKTAPVQNIKIRIAAIVFAVEPELVDSLVLSALTVIKG